MSRKPPRGGGSARALSCGRWPHLGDQIRNVAVSLCKQLLPAQLRTHRLLEQLRGWQTAGLHLLVQVVREVNLHAGHTSKYTPSMPPCKPASRVVAAAPLIGVATAVREVATAVTAVSSVVTEIATAVCRNVTELASSAAITAWRGEERRSRRDAGAPRDVTGKTHPARLGSQKLDAADVRVTRERVPAEQRDQDRLLPPRTPSSVSPLPRAAPIHDSPGRSGADMTPSYRREIVRPGGKATAARPTQRAAEA
jgi:hypothetical protein